MPTTRTALAVLTALMLGGCATAEPSSPPTLAPEAPATEVAPPTGLPEPATIAAPDGDLAAGDVAQTVFQAWVQGKREAVEPYVDTAAMPALDALLAQPFDPAAGWAFDHCEGAAGSVFCSWHSSSATMVVQVRSAEPPPLVIDIRLESAAAP